MGLRIRSLEAATRRRGLRTLDLFLGGLLAETELPDGFVVTLPKVTDVRQVEAMADVCRLLEEAYGLAPGRLRFESSRSRPPRPSWAPTGPPPWPGWSMPPAAAARLRADVERVGGGVLDEPATAQALAGFLARGLDCGALTEAEVTGRTGLDRAAIDGLTRRTGPTGDPTAGARGGR